MEEKSLLAQILEARVEERREELAQTPIEDVLKLSMEEIGLYVFSSTLDYVDGNESTGTIKVATDGMPERAKVAVVEVLRSQGITEFDWSDYPPAGQVSVCWEVVNESGNDETE